MRKRERMQQSSDPCDSIVALSIDEPSSEIIMPGAAFCGCILSPPKLVQMRRGKIPSFVAKCLIIGWN